MGNFVVSLKLLLLLGTSTDHRQTDTHLSPGRSASRLCSQGQRSRHRLSTVGYLSNSWASCHKWVMSLCVWVLGLSVFTWYYNCTTSRQAWCVGCCCSFLFLPVCEKKMFLVSVCEKLAKRERWVLTWEWTTPWDMWTASSLQNQSQTLENWVMNMILHFLAWKALMKLCMSGHLGWLWV